MHFKWLISFVIILLVFNNSYGQRYKSTENLSKTEIQNIAEISLQKENFEKAGLFYKKLLSDKPNDSKLNFLIGYCYLNTAYGKVNSIKYFEKAINNLSGSKKNDAPVEVYYYLAQAYHMNYQFSKAIKTMNILKDKISLRETLFLEKINLLLNYCVNASQINQFHLNFKIDNLPELNSKYSDRSPQVNESETELIFTSRRPSPKSRKKLADNQYSEDIFLSIKEDGKWSEPMSIGGIINSNKNEAVTFISNNRKKMLLTKIDKNRIDLYISNRNKDSSWEVPVKLPFSINNISNQPTACLSSDGNKIIFASDRKGGFGGTDLYESINKGNGKWSVPQNLGQDVNSSGNEESPFLHENGTLFFSSDAHNTIGGYDIFASERRDNDKWSKPINMGIPINSVSDDYFYHSSQGGQYAYFSSKRKGGKGESDIYRIYLNEPNNGAYAYVTGRIQYSDNKEDKLNIQINNLTNKQISQYNLIAHQQTFCIPLETKTQYELDFNYKGISLKKVKINVKALGSFLSLEQHIILEDLKIPPRSTNLSKLKPIVKNYQSKTKSDSSTLISRSENYAKINVKTFKDNNNTQNPEAKYKYSVLILSSKTFVNPNTFTDLNEIPKYTKNPDGSYNYYIGSYDYEWEATIKLRMIQDKYPNAKVFINKSADDKL